MSEIETAAPAQSEPTPAPALTAVESAVAKDDFTAYRENRRAERSGTPAPAPAADPVTTPLPAAAAAPVEVPRTVSKRQQDINERIRQSTARAIADRDAEIARLQSQLPAQPAAPRAEPKGEEFPDYPEYLETHPDASLRDYNAAQFKFLRGQEQAADAEARRRSDRERSQQESVNQAQARTIAARQADPAIDAKFKAWETPGAELPEVLFLQTRDQAIAAKQIPQAENDFASRVATSKFSAHLIAHVADHPEVLAEVRALESRGDVIAYVGALETLFKNGQPAPIPVQTKTISSAPTPGTPIGNRPASAADPIGAAVKAGDVTAYRAARLAQRSARR